MENPKKLIAILRSYFPLFLVAAIIPAEMVSKQVKPGVPRRFSPVYSDFKKPSIIVKSLLSAFGCGSDHLLVMVH